MAPNHIFIEKTIEDKFIEELKDENRSNNENDIDNKTEFEQAKIILSEIYQSVNLA